MISISNINREYNSHQNNGRSFEKNRKEDIKSCEFQKILEEYAASYNLSNEYNKTEIKRNRNN